MASSRRSLVIAGVDRRLGILSFNESLCSVPLFARGSFQPPSHFWPASTPIEAWLQTWTSVDPSGGTPGLVRPSQRNLERHSLARRVALVTVRVSVTPACRPSSASPPPWMRGSVEEDAGDGPGGVGWQVGGLRRGPLVPLCAQTEPVDLRREEVVQDEHDGLRTALQVQLNFAILAAEIEPQ